MDKLRNKEASLKPGRNDPCPCGSGKKYKHCCLAAQTESQTGDYLWHRLRRFNESLTTQLLDFAIDVFGREALPEAWEEFTGWEGSPFDPRTPHMQVFMPWFYYDWVPNPDETQIRYDAPSDQTVVGAFLEHQGKHLEPIERDYLMACLDAPFSFHEVVTCHPGSSFVLRDIFTGEEVDVTERAGSRGAQPADILFAKIVRIEHLALLDGCAPVLIPPGRKAPILELRQWMQSLDLPLTKVAVRNAGIPLMELYYELVESLLNPPMPELRNTDGDPMCFHKLLYDIDAPQAAFDALKGLALIHDEEELLADAERDDAGRLHKVAFSWHKRGNKLHKSWDNTILGNLTIEGLTLTVEVNSEKRAQKFRALAEKRLKGHARYKTTVIESPEAMLAERAQGKSSDPEALSDHEQLIQLPEVQAQLADMMRAHYENWLDEKIPALGGKTPRQAVKHPDGRELVEALLAQVERDAPRQFPFPLDEMFSRLRAELGLPSHG
jgi:hypothetical protein